MLRYKYQELISIHSIYIKNRSDPDAIARIDVADVKIKPTSPILVLNSCHPENVMLSINRHCGLALQGKLHVVDETPLFYLPSCEYTQPLTEGGLGWENPRNGKVKNKTKLNKNE